MKILFKKRSIRIILYILNILLKEKKSVHKKVVQATKLPNAKQSKKKEVHLEETPLLQAFFTFLSYTILQIFGHVREFLRKIGVDKRKGAVDNNNKV